MWQNLSRDHFEQAKARNRRQRAELDARYADESKRLDDQLAAIEADEAAAANLAARYAITPGNGQQQPNGASTGNGSQPQLSGRQQVLQALRALTASNNVVVSRADIGAEIQRRFGQTMPEGSITTYLGRLRRTGEAALHDNGRHWYAA